MLVSCYFTIPILRKRVWLSVARSAVSKIASWKAVAFSLLSLKLLWLNYLIAMLYDFITLLLNNSVNVHVNGKAEALPGL